MNVFGVDDKDILGGHGEPALDFTFETNEILFRFPDSFGEHILIVYPEDIHKVKVIQGESCLVEKACFKFKV